MNGGLITALQGSPLPPVETGLDAVRAILALVAVMVALAGFLWLLRRGTFTAVGRGRRDGLAIESAISLGDRRSLVIVSVDGRRLLLGVATAQVSLLSELGQPPAAFQTALDGAMAPEARRS